MYVYVATHIRSYILYTYNYKFIILATILSISNTYLHFVLSDLVHLQTTI